MKRSNDRSENRINEVIETIALGPVEEKGMCYYHQEIPVTVGEQGLNSILIEPLSGDGAYAAGHVLFE